MAHAHADVWATDPTVVINTAGDIEAKVGSVRLVLSREEAVQLAADLLEAADHQQAAA